MLNQLEKLNPTSLNLKENKIKDKNKALRKFENLKHDTNRKIGRAFQNLWTQLGKIGLKFLNIIPKLGKVVYEFLGNLFTDLFHGIYNQQFEPKKAKTVIIAITSVVVLTTIVFSSINYFSDGELAKKPEVKKEVKKEAKKPEIKKDVKKPKIKKKQKNLKKNQN